LATSENRDLLRLYHGTMTKNVEPILADGLRAGPTSDGVWFGWRRKTALTFSRMKAGGTMKPRPIRAISILTLEIPADAYKWKIIGPNVWRKALTPTVPPTYVVDVENIEEPNEPIEGYGAESFYAVTAKERENFRASMTKALGAEQAEAMIERMADHEFIVQHTQVGPFERLNRRFRL